MVRVATTTARYLIAKAAFFARHASPARRRVGYNSATDTNTATPPDSGMNQYDSNEAERQDGGPECATETIGS
jgi:hypothetical protein